MLGEQARHGAARPRRSERAQAGRGLPACPRPWDPSTHSFTHRPGTPRVSVRTLALAGAATAIVLRLHTAPPPPAPKPLLSPAGRSRRCCADGYCCCSCRCCHSSCRRPRWCRMRAVAAPRIAACCCWSRRLPAAATPDGCGAAAPPPTGLPAQRRGRGAGRRRVREGCLCGVRGAQRAR